MDCLYNLTSKIRILLRPTRCVTTHASEAVMRIIFLHSGVGFAAAVTALAACGARTGTLGDLAAGPPVPGTSSPSSNTEGRSLCAFDTPPASASAVLAVAAGNNVVFIRSDGSQRHVVDLQGTPGLGWAAVLANADHVLVAASYETLPPTGTQQILLDTSGAITWQRAEPNGALETELTGVTLSPRGLVAEQVQKDDASSHIVSDGVVRIGLDGTPQFFAGLHTLARANADGTMPVGAITSTSEESMTLGWLHADGSLHRVSGTWTAASRYAFDGVRFVYLDAEGTHVVVETEADRHPIALPGARPAGERVAVAGHWALLGDDLRVDLDTEHVESIAGPPSGLRRMVGAQRSLEEDGSVLDALRDDDFGGVFRSADLGKTWQRIGGTTRLASELHTVGVNGTYVVGAGMTFGGEQDWPEPPPGRPADLVGDGIEIVRPPTRLRILKQTWQGPVVVSSDGLCVAYLDHPADRSNATTLRVWNLETDQTTEVLTSEGPIEVTWIEAPAPIRLAR
jgi:hypothetical protein